MDESEFDELYAASYTRITRQVYAMIGDADEAAECVQEAFAKAWAHRRRLDRTAHPEAWVRTVAYRHAVSRWRRVQRSRRDPDRAHSRATDVAGPSADHVAVVTALRQLPDHEREAVVLHYIGDLSVRDVATELGVAEGTVKARLSRARARLAGLLEDTNGSQGAMNHA